MSNGVLLAQHNKVVALDIVPEKVEMLNSKRSPRAKINPNRWDKVLRCEVFKI